MKVQESTSGKYFFTVSTLTLSDMMSISARHTRKSFFKFFKVSCFRFFESAKTWRGHRKLKVAILKPFSRIQSTTIHDSSNIIISFHEY